MRRRTFLNSITDGIAGLTTLGLSGRGVTDAAQRVSTGVVSTGKPSGPIPSPNRTSTYRRIKSYLDSVPAIDLHEHLRGFDQLVAHLETEAGHGASLCGLWRSSYLGWLLRLSQWHPGDRFQDWWLRAKGDFVNVRAAEFYRYMWLAFRDLYGVDFDRISDDQAAELDRRIFENYRSPRWLLHVLEKSNIELMVCDRYWERFNFHADYPFEFLSLNIPTLVWGFHPSEYQVSTNEDNLRNIQRIGHPMTPLDDPYSFARERQIPMNSLDDYVALLDRMLVEAKAGDVVCLKNTLAAVRTLRFENVSKERAEKAFGHSRSELTHEQIKDFEDFIVWRLVELSARHDLPMQIHTGNNTLENSNPMLLVNLIDANPQTKFELFHGGFPWTAETGAITSRYAKNVWINETWLPTISYATAKNSFHEWLDVVPSNRFNWGGDDACAEAIYGSTELTRACWADVLSERVDRGDLLEEDSKRIGKQILRDNALALYPRLRDRLGKAKVVSPLTDVSGPAKRS